MSDSIYNQYYLKQVGSGISVYSGSRYQKGNGLLGKIMKYLKPALKYISRQGLTATSELTKNLASGKSLRDAAQSQLYSTGESIMKDGLEKIAKQKGGGVRRKRSVKRKTAKRRKVVKKPKGRKKLYKRRKTRRVKKKKLVSIF